MNIPPDPVRLRAACTCDPKLPPHVTDAQCPQHGILAFFAGDEDAPRELTMQDRLLVVAHIETLAMQDPTLRVIANSVIECVRCCDYFPECSHVVAESERVDQEEGRV